MKFISALSQSVMQAMLSALAIILAVAMLFSASFGALMIADPPKPLVRHGVPSYVATPPPRPKPEIILESLSINSGRPEIPRQNSGRNPPLRL